MSSFCLCSDMITVPYLYSYAALSLCTIIVRNQKSCKITVRFAMHRILADCTNSRGMSRACLKKAFRELRVPVCGRFYPNEGGVAGYGNRMRVKYTAKWGLQIAEMIFQTRSSHQLRLCSRGSADPRESLRRCRISSLLKTPAKGCLPGTPRPPASGFR